MSVSKAISVVMFLIFAVPGPMSAQDTRAQRLEQQRRDKSTRLQPPQSSGLEKLMYEFKERRILERYAAGFMGFHPMLGGLSTGSGFALGTQFRKADIANRSLTFTASGQASFVGYQKYEMTVDAPRLADERFFLSFNFRQRNFPQEDFFGIGSDSAETNRTNFRLEDTQYVATFGVRPASNVSVGAQVGILNNNTASGTDTRFPSVEQTFNVTNTPGIDRQPDYRHAGAFAQYDSRDEPFNPRSGSLFRAEGAYYDDRDFGSYSFRRWNFEAQQYLPFFNQRRVIAARTRLELSDTNPGQQTPFFLLPMLGGAEDLRGFREFRFRDKHSLVFNLEYRWEVFSGLDMAVFGDAGNVYSDIDDVKLNKLKTSYGIGFRFNTSKSVFLRFDIGFGHEGPRRFLKFGHVF